MPLGSVLDVKVAGVRLESACYLVGVHKHAVGCWIEFHSVDL